MSVAPSRAASPRSVLQNLNHSLTNQDVSIWNRLRQYGFATVEAENKVRASAKKAKTQLPIAIMDSIERCVADSMSRRIGSGLMMWPGSGGGSSSSKRISDPFSQQQAPQQQSGLKSILRQDEIRRMQEAIGRLIEEAVADITGRAEEAWKDQRTTLEELSKEGEASEKNMLSKQSQLKAMKDRMGLLEMEMKANKEELLLLRGENSAKEKQLDVLRHQVKRRNELLEEQRMQYHEEMMMLKGQLFGSDNNPIKKMVDDLDLTSVGISISFGSSVANISNDAPRETIEEQCERKYAEKMRKLKEQFAKEKKQLLKERQLIVEMKDQLISSLRSELTEYRELALNASTGGGNQLGLG